MAKDDRGHWALFGEGIVAFARGKRALPPLPKGLHALPGPVMVLGERFADSPVGPFLALSFGQPVRLGLRPGYHFGTSVISSPDARRLGREIWGFPHELGTLHWASEAGWRTMIWDERGIELRAEVIGRPLPALVPVRSMQQRNDGRVVIPESMRAKVRRSKIELSVDAEDPLAVLAGRHMGFTLSGMLLRRHPARAASGLLSTLRIPLRAAEPGVAMKFEDPGHADGLFERISRRSTTSM